MFAPMISPGTLPMKPIQTHKGWRIYKASIHTSKGYPYYLAVKDDVAIEGIDLPDLIGDIDEAER